MIGKPLLPSNKVFLIVLELRHMIKKLSLAFVLHILFGSTMYSQEVVWPGALDGVESFQLFDTPNGLKPMQCWYSISSLPDGMIYLSGSDHSTNSALYKFDPVNKILTLCGDAKSAAEAANNLHSGETFEKFHCQPTWLNGKVYVASMDYSKFDDGYLNKYGFHWFVYDTETETFTDLSANETNGVAAEHCQVLNITADTVRNVIYAVGLPTAHLYRLDPVTGLTTDLGRPPFDFPDDFPAISVFPWIGKDGKVYFSLDGGDEAIYDHIYYYDPETGYGEMKDWKIYNNTSQGLEETKRIKMGAWTANREECYVTNNYGDIHLFHNEDNPSWEYIGSVEFGTPYNDGTFYSRTMHLSKDESCLYFVNDVKGENFPGFFLIEFNLESKKSRRVVKLEELDPILEYTADLKWHGGINVWDEEGYFYFVSFGWNKENIYCTRINPDLLPHLNDHTPPSMPENLVLTALSETSYLLSWEASTDDINVAGYNVYEESALLTSQTSLSYNILGLDPELNYTFSVSAYDDSGNESDLASVQIEATTEVVSNAEKQTIIYSAGKDVYIHSQSESPVRYNIIDISGRILQSGEIHYGDNRLIVNSGTGIYIVNIISIEGVKTQKIYIQ